MGDFMAATKEKDNRFDPVKLSNMTEPLTVRVEKMRGHGNVRQPIELPSKGDAQTGFMPPGTGWTRDEVMQLENFILTKWSGGGYYDFTVTDAKGDRMSWPGVWDTRLYPEKVPPNTVEAALVSAVQAQTPAAGPSVPMNAQPMGSQPQTGWPPNGWTPNGIGYNNPAFSGPIMPPGQVANQQTQQNPQWVQPQQQGPWGQQGWPQQGPWVPPQHAFEPPLRARDDHEKRELAAKLQQAELAMKDLEHRTALQQMQQQHAQQMQAVQEELRRLSTTNRSDEDSQVQRMREQLMEQQLKQMQQQSEAQVAALREQIARVLETPRDNDELRRLRADQERQAIEIQRQREEYERRIERERDQRERERRDEQIQREMREAREATERRIEALTASRHASDPIFDALKETTRMQTEQMREMARLQQANTDKMAAFMVAPAQLASIMKDNSHGADGVMRSMIQSVGEIGNLYKSAAESVLQMSGGGSEPPAVRLIQEGMARAGEVVDRFLAVKRDSVISEGKVKQAEVQRDQTKIQAEAHLRSQAMHVQAQQQQQHWSPPPPVVSGNGEARPVQGPEAGKAPNGATAGGFAGAQASTKQPRRSGMIEYQEPSKPKHAVGPIDLPPEPVPPNSTAPPEEEIFKMAYESVQRLRRGVADGKLTPDQTVDAILQGVQHVLSNGLDVPAFTLFQQERWADFMDIMLPEAPQTFRDECAQILAEETDPAGPDDLVETSETGDGATA